MRNHYLRFNSNEKVSVVQSMIVMTDKFLESYEWDLSTYTNDDELVNDLYFYWLRMSASKSYVWCKEYDEFFLSNEFADEMKSKLKTILYRSLILNRESPLEK